MLAGIALEEEGLRPSQSPAPIILVKLFLEKKVLCFSTEETKDKNPFVALAAP